MLLTSNQATQAVCGKFIEAQLAPASSGALGLLDTMLIQFMAELVRKRPAIPHDSSTLRNLP